MPAFPLLWPIIALAALVFTVWLTLVVKRVRHIRANPPTVETLATGASAKRYFEPVELPANNLANLFEMPVLFFVLAILLIVTELANDVQVILAWVFVLLRMAHSWVHIVVRKVPVRATLYWLSTIVLLVMWVGFAVDTLVAARAYNDTMATLEAGERM